MRPQPIGARSFKRRLGALMMVVSLGAAGALSAFTPAIAQEAGPQAKEAKTTKQGYYNAPLYDVLPPTLVSEFPPGVVCIVEPQLCPKDLKPVKDAVEGAMGQAAENEPVAPFDPVPPGTLPVSVLGGRPRYRAAVQFEVPTIPDGQQADTFQVVLTEGQPTYDSSSPMFRQAVLAALASVREPSPDDFQKILDQEPVETEPLPVEMCPIVGDWEGAESQPQDKLPEVDCLYGSNGTRNDDGTWTFDLSLAAQAWNDGSLKQNGVLLRPQQAPNLAYGDPDPSYNKQVTFEGTVKVAMTTSEASEPVTFDDTSTGTTGSSAGSSSSTGTMSGLSSGSAPSGGDQAFSAPMQLTPEEQAAAPQVAAPAPASGSGTPVAMQQSAPPMAQAAAPGPTTPWWTWLLAPVFLAGAYLLTRSLTAPLAVEASRSGAMTRLIAQRRAQSADLPEFV